MLSSLFWNIRHFKGQFWCQHHRLQSHFLNQYSNKYEIAFLEPNKNCCVSLHLVHCLIKQSSKGFLVLSCLPQNQTQHRPMKRKMDWKAWQQQNERRHEEGDQSVESTDILRSLSYQLNRLIGCRQIRLQCWF